MDIHVIVKNPVLKRGEQPDVIFQIFKNDGQYLDLTDKEVQVIIKRWITSETAVIDSECEVTDAEEGLCKLYLTEDDTLAFEEGRYLAEITVLFDDTSTGEIEYSDNLVMWVKKSLRDG